MSTRPRQRTNRGHLGRFALAGIILVGLATEGRAASGWRPSRSEVSSEGRKPSTSTEGSRSKRNQLRDGSNDADSKPDWQKSPRVAARPRKIATEAPSSLEAPTNARPISKTNAVRRVSHDAVFAEREELIPTPDPKISRETIIKGGTLGPGETIVEGGTLGPGETIVEGEMGEFIPGGFDGEEYHSGEFVEEGGEEFYEEDCGPEGCVPCGNPYHEDGHFDRICIPGGWLRETSIFAGTQAFKGPVDLGRNGNFGFHEGVNFAGSLLHVDGIGYQIGANFLQSNLLGDSIGGVGSTTRQQTFLSAGLYRRAPFCRGLQGGVIFDYLEDRYYVRARMSQVRAEISYITFSGHEFGFWGAFGSGTDTVLTGGVSTVYKTTDLYTGFWRYTLQNGSQGRIWGGGSGNGDGVIGADFRVPISNRFDFTGGFNYLFPPGQGPVAAARESWGLSMSLVWFIGRRPQGVHHTRYRPLFNVADNSVFFTEHQP